MKILVLGIGNILMRDEGVGVRVVEYLQKFSLPPEVELMDGGTSTLSLFPYFTEVDHLIVIDAVKGKQPPGTIYRLTPEDLRPTENSPISVHDLGLLEALHMAKLIGKFPKTVTIFGVEPKIIDIGMELTPEIEEKVSHIAKFVLSEIKKLLD